MELRPLMQVHARVHESEIAQGGKSIRETPSYGAQFLEKRAGGGLSRALVDDRCSGGVSSDDAP